ncbi:MAG: hypothetical protein HYU39_06080 [Thaumarchaeota archaeon]|nr:hypothetical protein [Nitrososphaerota archaeon]
MDQNSIESKNYADVVLDILQEIGVKYVFGNPDSASTPIFDSMVGRQGPELVLFLHEFAAVAAADGYGICSGQPGVACVGSTVGPMNAHGAFFNSYAGGRPLVVLTVRYGTAARYGAAHESRDLGGLVREFTKWDFEVINNEYLENAMLHAFNAARSPPRGPTLLILNKDLLLQKARKRKVNEVHRYKPAELSEAEHSVTERITQLLVDAENPIIITNSVGAYQSAVPRLIELTELLSIPVIEGGLSAPAWMNYPTAHPLHLGYCVKGPNYTWKVEKTATADVIFVIQCDIPADLPYGSTVIQLDEDSIQIAPYVKPIRPADIRLACSTEAQLRALIIKVRKLISKRSVSRYKERLETLKAEHNSIKAKWREECERHLNEEPISPWRVGYELNKVKGDGAILVKESGLADFHYDIYRRVLEFNEPGTLFCSGGGHQGGSMGMAVGIKLARPHKRVIALIGDGTFNYGGGLGVLWTIAHHNIPIMYVIDNNRSYGATMRSQRLLGGKSFKAKRFPGHDLSEPPIRFEEVAHSINIYAETISRADDVGPALARAIETVDKGEPVLLDIVEKNLVLSEND